MVKVYYAKFNVNSDLIDLKEKGKLQEVLNKFVKDLKQNYKNFNYKKEIQYKEEDPKSGEEVIKTYTDIYHVSQLEEVIENEQVFLLGYVVRENPRKIEVFDKGKDEVKNANINQIAHKTAFVFHLPTETIAFTERQSLGRNQIMEALEQIFEQALEEYSVAIYLKEDTRLFIDRLKELKKIEYFEVELVSPNFCEDEMDALREEAREIGNKMDKEGITKKVTSLESKNKEGSGIKTDGEIFKDNLREYEVMSSLGYAKSQVKGKVNSQEVSWTSEEMAPITTEISAEERDNWTDFIKHVFSKVRSLAVQKTLEQNEDSSKGE